MACLYIRCILQACIRECLVAGCGCGSSPGLKLCTRFRKSGCADGLRRRAGERIDEGRSSVGGVGARVRRRRARHCHEGRASMMGVGENVAIVMGRWQYGAGGGTGVLSGCEVVRRRQGGGDRLSAEERRRLCILRGVRWMPWRPSSTLSAECLGEDDDCLSAKSPPSCQATWQEARPFISPIGT